ncbi:hypothetical protein [Butyrivibrio sp. VCB2006]|uniref:hypothetical protein n=1 Tax=Butyrivibrio sp. VCB2006 TaxID=1280679 RepID=UPI0004298A77|nr:hypothetical protein [Butyrivibrio sp. VCB2006]
MAEVRLANGSNKKKMTNVFMWVFMVLGALFTLFLIWKKDFYMENSDIASDMILGKLLSQEGGILSKNWFYSTELHVIHTQLLYKLLFHIWPDNWLMVRLAAALVFLVLIVASFLFMTKALGLKEEGLLAASILTWPFGQWYVRIVTFGQSYVTYFIIAFVSMGLFFRAVQGKRYNAKTSVPAKDGSAFTGMSIVYAVLLAVISFLAGLGGVRLLMICYAPLFATSLAVMLFSHFAYFTKKEGAKEFGTSANLAFIFALIPFVFSCIGLAVNRKVLCQKYNFQDQFRETWRDFSFSRILDTLSDSLTLFGWHAEVGFVSWQGLINCLNFLLIVGIVASIIYVIKNIWRFRPIIQLFLVYVGVLTLITTVVLSCSNKYYSYYWLPVIPYFLIVLALALFNPSVDEGEQWDKFELSMVNASYGRSHKNVGAYVAHYKTAICGFIAAAIAFASISVYADPNPQDIYQDYAITDAIMWLRDSTDYEEGFGMFWSSNVIKALTNGRIDMHTVMDVDHIDDLGSEYPWLQEVRHTEEFPEGKFFVIVSARDYDLGNQGSAMIFGLGDHLIYGSDSAYIYGFENMDDFVNSRNSLW